MNKKQGDQIQLSPGKKILEKKENGFRTSQPTTTVEGLC